MKTTSLCTTASILCVIICMAAQTSFGQIRLSRAGLNAGLAERLEMNGALNTLVFYPEIYGGGEFFLKYVEWSIYWGYWNDHIRDNVLTDYEVRSSHGHIIGARLAFLPQKVLHDFLLPIAVYGGFAHHFITTSPVVSWPGFVMIPRSDGTEQSNTFELGLRVYYDIPASLQIRVEGRQFFALGKEEYSQIQSGRRIYTLGVAMSF